MSKSKPIILAWLSCIFICLIPTPLYGCLYVYFQRSSYIFPIDCLLLKTHLFSMFFGGPLSPLLTLTACFKDLKIHFKCKHTEHLESNGWDKGRAVTILSLSLMQMSETTIACLAINSFFSSVYPCHRKFIG